MNDYSTIRSNTRWFLDHSDHWDRLSVQATKVASMCEEIVIPAGTLDWPGFSTFKQAYTRTANVTVARYQQGARATELTARLLDWSARRYAVTEADNADLSDKLLKELEGEF
jgi:hypothetical protein